MWGKTNIPVTSIQRIEIWSFQEMNLVAVWYSRGMLYVEGGGGGEVCGRGCTMPIWGGGEGAAPAMGNVL